VNVSRAGVALTAGMLAVPVLAQTTVSTAGQGFWNTLVNLLYGWPGLLVGLLFFVAAVYLWVKEGALPAVMTGIAGVMLFFSPAVAVYIQKEGSAATQNITPVKPN
jgi:TM2 domain-containing membrane protein YozV